MVSYRFRRKAKTGMTAVGIGVRGAAYYPHKQEKGPGRSPKTMPLRLAIDEDEATGCRAMAPCKQRVGFWVAQERLSVAS
jgi:hypothetical protein